MSDVVKIVLSVVSFIIGMVILFGFLSYIGIDVSSLIRTGIQGLSEAINAFRTAFAR